MAQFAASGPPFLDARTRRVGELLVVVWLLSMADLFFTIWAHLFTAFYELNPIARSMLHNDELSTLVFYKVVATFVGTMIFWRARHHWRAEFALWCIAAVYVLLAVRWSDYTAGATVAMAM